MATDQTSHGTPWRTERPGDRSGCAARRPSVQPTAMRGPTSPNLDRLAQQGVLFEHAFATVLLDAAVACLTAHRPLSL